MLSRCLPQKTTRKTDYPMFLKFTSLWIWFYVLHLKVVYTVFSETRIVKHIFSTTVANIKRYLYFLTGNNMGPFVEWFRLPWTDLFMIQNFCNMFWKIFKLRSTYCNNARTLSSDILNTNKYNVLRCFILLHNRGIVY